MAKRTTIGLAGVDRRLKNPREPDRRKKNAAVMMTKAEIVSGIAGVIDVND